MNHISYYDILGIDKKASHEEIVKAYEIKSRMYYTGKGAFFIYKPKKSNEEYQNELNKAFRILSDCHYKKIYDIYGYDKLQTVISDNKFNDKNIMETCLDLFIEKN